jgi:TatD DNase family protein
MIDTHCHLDAGEFAADLDAVLGEARRRGVTAVVIPAVDPSNWEAVEAITTRAGDALPERRYALGMHPVYIDRCDEEAIDALRAAATVARADPLFVGIGEIGLDHFVAGLDLHRQLAFFVAQLRIARDLDLPVILHVRRAIDPVSRELRRLGPFSGIAHAFNGSAQQAERMIGLGLALGFGGAATFSRARNIRRLAASVPLEAIVLETDSPDIAPAWLAPGRNTPAELPAIADEIARLRGITREQLVTATDANARRVLRWR